MLSAIGCGRSGFDSRDDAAPPPDVATPDATTGPVVAYAMDDDPSTGRITSSSSEFDGTCTRCPTQTAGRLGNAYAFDGSAEVRLPAPAGALLGTAPYTVSMWLNATTMPQTSIGVVIAKPFSATSDANVYSVWVNHDPPGQVFYETTPSGEPASYEFVSSPVGVDVRGTWHHVATTWDGTTKRLYVDGAVVASSTMQVVGSSELIVLGTDVDNNTVTLHYVGALDELQLYARALGDSEIAALAAP